jgi:NADPH:quinone reductase-like Zn-dependent oxidoreductase
MKAIRVHRNGGPEALVLEEAPTPHPGPGEVLVRVQAAGVTPAELGWSATRQTRTGAARTLAIPGHDLAGIVAGVGADVHDVSVGTPVFALTDFWRDGGGAEYAIARPNELAPKPRSLDYVQAAAVPLAALTAWQGLLDHAELSAEQMVLIHGAAGGVGVFAVQLARWIGAYVIATASPRNLDLVLSLGADEIIDHTRVRFEDVVHDVDVVFDTVGGDTLERSWRVLRKGGALVSIVETPSPEKAAALDVRAAFFIVEPNRERLARVGELIDAGKLRPVVGKVFSLADARRAYEGASAHGKHGKIVLKVT